MSHRNLRVVLAAELRKGDNFLELECGNGRYGLALGQTVSRCTGLDVCVVAGGYF